MFQKILIANRGEIACRVVKTARRMGIATVAVYSEADRDALHVQMADEAVLLGPAPSRESYLVADRIIAACKETGAEAVHPGYGFLSENEAFARRVEEAGFVFIGPKHEAIAAMGDKIASKQLAGDVKVNTIPGWNAAIESPERAVEIARGIGYPVMIKASAGGGGKGLRVAHDDAEARDGFASCRSEASSSFGDDRVFIEKFVESPRHIEIQVLGDAHGNLVYLHERECSIQRRHQKVIEEAPSPFISDATRRAMGEQAVALARAVRYQSAGTVEFVVGADQRFYFLEMNTRLQVEHPVTECITGLDLVEWMIRVAAGEPLGFAQADIPRRGWAIECRINAEDPLRGFLPSTGRLVRFAPPEATLRAGEPAAAAEAGGVRIDTGGVRVDTGGVRVDTGVEEGGTIPIHYDSMIAKLIVHGSDRADAVARMREALDAFVIRGVSSNIAFQAALLAHPKFAAGDFTTGFIAEQYPAGFGGTPAAPEAPSLLVALAAALHEAESLRVSTLTGASASQAGVRGPAAGGDRVVIVKGPEGAHRHVLVRRLPDGAGWAVGEAASPVVLALDGPARASRVVGRCDGRAFTAQVERRGVWRRLAHHGATIEALVLSPHAAALHRLMPYKPPPDSSRLLLSPMPGLLVQIAVRPGQAVRAGERLAVIEAMKMENVLTAARDATVDELLAVAGESVAVDQPILSFARAAAG